MRALPELVEAAARAGQAGLAHDAVKQLAEITQPCGNDSALGIEARCWALLSHDADADQLYREAIDRLGRTQLRPELGRAQGRLPDAGFAPDDQGTASKALDKGIVPKTGYAHYTVRQAPRSSPGSPSRPAPPRVPAHALRVGRAARQAADRHRRPDRSHEDMLSVSVVCPDRWFPATSRWSPAVTGHEVAGQVEGLDVCTGEVTIRLPGS